MTRIVLAFSSTDSLQYASGLIQIANRFEAPAYVYMCVNAHIYGAGTYACIYLYAHK